jgi:hypothetical protein
MTQITYPQKPNPTYSSDLAAFLESSDNATARSSLGLGSAAESDASSFAVSSHGHASSEISDFATAVAAEINSFVGGAPDALDSWAELVAAIQNDQSGLASLTSVVAGKLPLAGGVMSGAIDLGGNKLQNVAGGTLATDAVNYGQVGSAIGNALKIVDVGGGPGLPAIDGSQLTNLPTGGGNPFDQSLNTTDSATFVSFGVLNGPSFVVGSGAGRLKLLNNAGNESGTRITVEDIIDPSNRFFIDGSQSKFSLAESGSFSWSSTVSALGLTDLKLQRGAPGILEQRNGTNPQTHRVFGTYTSGSGTDDSNDINGEWLSLGYNGTEFEIATRAGSSGGSNRDLVFKTGNNDRLKIDSSGHTRVFSGRFLYFSHHSSANGISELGGKLTIFSAGLLLQGIPTSNPNIANQLWNDNGTLKISTG